MNCRLEAANPGVEQAIQTAALMLETDKSRGYCLEMICADFLAGANLDNGNPDTLLHSVSRFFKFLPGEQRQAFVQQISERCREPDSAETCSPEGGSGPPLFQQADKLGVEVFGAVAFHSAPSWARRHYSDGGKVRKGLLLSSIRYIRVDHGPLACGFQTARGRNCCFLRPLTDGGIDWLRTTNVVEGGHGQWFGSLSSAL